MATLFGAKKFALLWLFILALPLVACRQRQISASDIQFELTAADLRVGQTTLQVTVKDKAGAPLKDPGALQIRGDMNHAGMLPIFAQAESAPEGIFNLPFEWTMAGDWIVETRL